jgi:hypothetical protein
VRRQRPRGLTDGVLEKHGTSGQRIDVRSGLTFITVRAHVVGAHGVHRDEDDVAVTAKRLAFERAHGVLL